MPTVFQRITGALAGLLAPSGVKASGEEAQPSTQQVEERLARLREVEPASHKPQGPGGSRRPDSAFRPGPDDVYHVNYRPPDPERTWDPFDQEQSRANRARAARRRAAARSQQPGGPDYYAVLGVDRLATAEEIERQYRKHVAVIHPDRFYDNPRLRADAEQKLRQLNEAAAVLRDPERRRRYDQEWGL